MPPTGRFLLDTNVIIALFARDAAVIAGLTGAEAVFVPAVALGELYFGARKSRQSRENLAKITDFAARSVVMAADAATAAAYGELKAELRTRGTPIPENDVWIAALARQNQLTLASRDAHFEHVSRLTRVSWS